MSDENNTKTTESADAAVDVEAAPPPPETVTLTIDGVEVTVPKGTNVLEAARSCGTDISAFCYHPGLSIAACCRQCLVSVEKAPKLMPSCQTTAGDGMVVSTKDERSSTARTQMLEFTLVNHPIDCPICDKAGECTLQQLYFDNDNLHSRVDIPKVHKPKRVDLGPHVVLDAERCILCTRCIRVCDEVAGEHQLEMSNRGNREQLGTAPGAVLDNPYSINTVDVCPVGALTSKDFRFKMRAWQLMMTPSVCQGCATGCNVEIHHSDDRVWRLVPRCNLEVNKHWMCDEGRFTYHGLRDDRLASAVVDGLPASISAGIARAAQLLKPLLAEDREGIGLVLSPQMSNEANFALAKLGIDIWQLDNIFVAGKPPVQDRADDILRDADVNPNTAGVKAILGKRPLASAAVLEDALMAGEIRTLVVLGHDVALSEEALAKTHELETLIVISDREVGVARHATVALPCAAWAEDNGTVTNRQGHVQRMHAAFDPAGQAVPAWKLVVQLAQACDAALKYTDAETVFKDMVAAVPAFSGAEWGRNARPIQLRFAYSRG